MCGMFSLAGVRYFGPFVLLVLTKASDCGSFVKALDHARKPDRVLHK